MFLRYLKTAVWRFILCCLMSFSLIEMALQGFDMPSDQLEHRMLRVVIILILTAILAVAAYGKKTILAGIIGFAAVIIIGIVWMGSRGALAAAFVDSEDNRYLLYILLFVLTVGIYLLALTRRGIFVLLVFGCGVCALIHYLYHENRAGYLILFLVCAVVSLAMKNYQTGVLRSDDSRPAFAGAFVMSAACGALAVLVGCGIYFALIPGINPPVRVLKLYDKEMAMTMVNQMGIAETVKIPSPALREQMKESEDKNSKQQNSQQKDEHNQNQDNTDENQNNEGEQIPERDMNSMVESFYAIKDPLPGNHIVAYLIILAAVIAGICILKVLSRNWRLKRLERYTKEEQVSMLYHFFLKKFDQLNMGKPAFETPYEYAGRQKAKLGAFDSNGTGIMQLTDIFVKIGYAGGEITDEDYKVYISYYRHLFGRMRSYLGMVRYIFQFYFFRL